MTKTKVAPTEPRFGQGLEAFVVPINQPQHHPRNPRKHRVDLIKRSLARYGQQTPLTVQRSTGYVCKGNGTLKAAKELGWDRIAARFEDFDDDTALGYLYADNRASDVAEYDKEATLAGLQALGEGPGAMDTLWDVDALEDLEYQVHGAKPTDASPFAGGYAEGGEAGERAAGDTRPGTKMKEVPVVMTVAEHELFMQRLRTLQKAHGTSGNIATIIRAVELAAAAAEGRPAPMPAATADEVRLALLKELTVHYDDRGADIMKGAAVAAHLLELQGAIRERIAAAAPPPKELPGQTHLSDHVGVSGAGAAAEESAAAGTVQESEEVDVEAPLAAGEQQLEDLSDELPDDATFGDLLDPPEAPLPPGDGPSAETLAFYADMAEGEDQ